MCGPDICVVAATENSWREHKKALRAGDTYGGADLLMSGKIFVVKQGTRALVVDYNPSTALSKIRIVEGKGKGLAGWVPFEHITSQ